MTLPGFWHTVGRRCQRGVEDQPAVCLGPKAPQSQWWQDIHLLCILKNIISEHQETVLYCVQRTWMILKIQIQPSAGGSGLRGHTLQVVCHSGCVGVGITAILYSLSPAWVDMSDLRGRCMCCSEAHSGYWEGCCRRARQGSRQLALPSLAKGNWIGGPLCWHRGLSP